MTRGISTETSYVGLGVTVAALLVMSLLAWLKRRTARATNNRALAADAIQSATCAFLTAFGLVGLAINAVFHIPWMDSIAALAMLPLFIIEGRRSSRADGCASG